MANLLLTILDKAGIPQEQRRRQHRTADGAVDARHTISADRRIHVADLQKRMAMS